MANLYEINEELINLLDERDDILEAQEGEITEEVEDLDNLIDHFKMLKGDKIENIALYIKNLTSDAKAIKSEIDNLTARKKAVENRAENLKSYLLYALEGNKLNTPKVVVGYRKSESTNIVNLESIPKEYLKEKVTITADKTAIKKAIKGGAVIEGAELVQKIGLTIK